MSISPVTEAEIPLIASRLSLACWTRSLRAISSAWASFFQREDRKSPPNVAKTAPSGPSQAVKLAVRIACIPPITPASPSETSTLPAPLKGVHPIISRLSKALAPLFARRTAPAARPAATPVFRRAERSCFFKICFCFSACLARNAWTSGSFSFFPEAIKSLMDCSSVSIWFCKSWIDPDFTFLTLALLLVSPLLVPPLTPFDFSPLTAAVLSFVALVNSSMALVFSAVIFWVIFS